MPSIDPNDEDLILLPSGRHFHANQGIVGIDDHGDISEGYDGSIVMRGAHGEVTKPYHLTKQERQELASIMITRWSRFALEEPDE